MEQLQNFSRDFLLRSITNTLDAEEYYNNVFTTVEEEFMGSQVQKTKKHKQANESASSRKGAAVPDPVDAASSNKENVDRSNALAASEESSVMDETSQRPVRARRTKLNNLRESIISGEKKIRIKKEPVDKPAAKPKSPPVVIEEPVVIPETPVAEKRKSSHDEADAPANVSSESNKKVKLDDSVELIAKKPDLIEVSDDEAEIMPPPALPMAKTRKPRAKKPSTAPTTSSSGSVKVKQEPVEEVIPKRSTRSKVAKSKTAAAAAAKEKEQSQSEAEELFENIVPKVRNSSIANASTLSTETSVTTAQQQQQPPPPPVMAPPAVTVTATEPEKTRSKARTKSKKPVIDKVTKLVIPEPTETESEVETVVAAPPPVVEEKRKSSPVKPAEKEAPVKAKASKKNASKKQSTESVYEDAKSDSKLYNSQVSLEDIQKIPSVDEPEEVEVPAPVLEPVQQMEVDVEPPNVNNETFVTTTATPVVMPPPTVVKPIVAAAAPLPPPPAVESPHLDSTFNVAPPKSKKNSVPQDSIMTEDLSMAAEDKPMVKREPVESPPRKAPLSKAITKATPAKKAHEIFNPFVQSPVKSKVDAYERHAKESKIPVTPKYVHVPRLPAVAASQPLPTRMRDNDTTPLKSGGGLLGTISDTTGNKLAHMKKVLGKNLLSGASSSDSARGSSSTISSSSSAKSISRANSTSEDAKRMANALQAVTEEKKRKREEKQRLAQLNREKMEKEKKEQLDRLAKEREEKAKKFLVEKAEAAKQEKKKQIMARLAMENSQQMKIKELQMKQKAAHADANGYGWDLLRSEDSTDDEEKQNKLPPPPAWSQNPLRTRMANMQAYIPSNHIDTLFGLKPMSPDLREIFPDIDPKLLKRNSSMIWKTPPRFSRIERP